MHRRTFLMATAALLALPSSSFAAAIPAKLYKDPNCGCCSGYGKHLSAAGFAVEVIETPDFAEIGRKAGVPEELEGCQGADGVRYGVTERPTTRDAQRLVIPTVESPPSVTVRVRLA
jgi:hypothetical protein